MHADFHAKVPSSHQKDLAVVGGQAGGAGAPIGLMTANAYNAAATSRDNYSYGQTMDEGLLYRNL